MMSDKDKVIDVTIDENYIILLVEKHVNEGMEPVLKKFRLRMKRNMKEMTDKVDAWHSLRGSDLEISQLRHDNLDDKIDNLSDGLDEIKKDLKELNKKNNSLTTAVKVIKSKMSDAKTWSDSIKDNKKFYITTAIALLALVGSMVSGIFTKILEKLMGL